MASTNTLAGMLLLNDKNMADIYPSNVLDDAPVVRALYAQGASQGGTYHKYLRRTVAAGASFRDIGMGVANAAEQFEEVDIICRILDASFERDVALAEAFRGGRSGYMQKETLAALKSAMFTLEKAIFNNNISGGGFVGLPYTEQLSDQDLQVVVAGTGSSNANKSVYLLRTGEDAVSIIAGNDGRISMDWTDDNPTVVSVLDAGGTNRYSAYRNTILGYFGLQVGGTYDSVRIANLDGTSDDLLTDDLIAEALMKFPAGKGPNMICMNRTCLKELQNSRTATNPTGAPAPFPVEAFGVPIIVTDALLNTEPVVNSSTGTTTTTSSY